MGWIGRRAIHCMGDSMSSDEQERSRQSEHQDNINVHINAIKDSNWEVRSKAVMTLVKIGVLAVPALIEALNDPDEGVRGLAAWSLERIGSPTGKAVLALIKAMKDPSENVRKSAFAALGQITGSEAATAVPALMETLKDPFPDAPRLSAERLARTDVRMLAAQALGQIGKPATAAIPVLIEALNYPDQQVNRWAAWALVEIGGATAVSALFAMSKPPDERSCDLAIRALEHSGGPAATVPVLIEALKYPDWSVRHWVTDALGNTGSPETALPALIEALILPDEGVRIAAAWALGKIGAPAATAVPALTAAIKDTITDVREWAIEALGKIGGPAAEAVPALIEAIRDPREQVRNLAFEALGKIGDQAVAVPTLIETLEIQDAGVRAWVAKALGKIGAPAVAAVPALTTATKDQDVRVRDSAFKALGMIGSPAVAAIPALIEAVKLPFRGIRILAAEALGMIGGPAAVAAVPALIEAARDPFGDVSASALEALGQLGNVAEAAIPSLTDMLKYHFFNTREFAVVTLQRIGGLTSVIFALIEVLRSPHARARTWAANALGAIGGQAATAVPALVAALRDSDEVVRGSAVEALVKIGAPPEVTVPAFIGVLDDTNEDNSQNTALALTRIGTPAVPALYEAIHHSNAMVRSAATRILALIAPEKLIDEKPTPSGIGRMAKAYDLKEALKLFYRIGALCLDEYEGKFSFRQVAPVIDLSEPTIREMMTDVTDFFRDYFSLHGHPPERGPFVAAPDDATVSWKEKIIQRSERRQSRICEPFGRWAWELTRDFLIAIHALSSPA